MIFFSSGLFFCYGRVTCFLLLDTVQAYSSIRHLLEKALVSTPSVPHTGSYDIGQNPEHLSRAG